EARGAALHGAPHLRARAATVRRDELDVVRRADVTLVRSHVERAALLAAVPGAHVAVLPLPRDAPGPRASFAARAGVAFVGGFRHPPNLDAVRWLLADVWPRVRRQRPGAALHVAGSDAPAEALAHDGVDGVRVHGWVDDV